MIIRATIVLLALFVGQTASSDELLFFGCKSCHGEQGRGSEALDAPAIAGMEKSYVATQMRNFRDGVRGKALDDLAGRQMTLIAAVVHEDAAIASLANYVAALPRSRPLRTVPSKGIDAADLYNACAACHGSNGEGSELGPALAWLDDWYVLRQLRNFKNGSRGSDPRDVDGQLMKASTKMLSDNDIVELAAYVVRLSGKPD